MITLLTVLAGLGMLATLGVMLAGMLGLTRSDATGLQSNTLMRWRVVLQGATLLIVALLLLLTRH